MFSYSNIDALLHSDDNIRILTILWYMPKYIGVRGFVFNRGEKQRSVKCAEGLDENQLNEASHPLSDRFHRRQGRTVDVLSTMNCRQEEYVDFLYKSEHDR